MSLSRGHFVANEAIAFHFPQARNNSLSVRHFPVIVAMIKFRQVQMQISQLTFLNM